MSILCILQIIVYELAKYATFSKDALLKKKKKSCVLSFSNSQSLAQIINSSWFSLVWVFSGNAKLHLWVFNDVDRSMQRSQI